MGELIILAEWKKQHTLCELNELESLLDQYISHLNLRRQFFMFDIEGNPVELFLKEENA